MAWSVGGNLMKQAERLLMIQAGMEMMETSLMARFGRNGKIGGGLSFDGVDDLCPSVLIFFIINVS